MKLGKNFTDVKFLLLFGNFSLSNLKENYFYFHFMFFVFCKEEIIMIKKLKYPCFVFNLREEHF